MKKNLIRGSVVIALLSLAACAGTGTGDKTTKASVSSKAISTPMRWDPVPQSKTWTESGFRALQSHGAVLPTVVPRDIETWCPGYTDASAEEREAFWVGLISTLAKHESTWNPSAVGGGGRWFGLVQISPSTARLYGCEAKSGNALKNGSDNVSCAIRIMSHTVPRDGVVSQGMRGVAADWGPFHSSRKREDMIAWTRSQPFCQPKKKGPLALLTEAVDG